MFWSRIVAFVYPAGVILFAWHLWTIDQMNDTTFYAVCGVAGLAAFCVMYWGLFLGVFSDVLWSILPLVSLAVCAIIAVIYFFGVNGGENQPDVGSAVPVPSLVIAIGVATGWIATWLAAEIRREKDRRARRRDTLMALRSEVFAFVTKLDNQPIKKHAEGVQSKIRKGVNTPLVGAPQKTYMPFSLSESEPFIFQAVSDVVPELEEDTLEPILRFYAEYSDFRCMVADSRTDDVKGLPADRHIEFHKQMTNRRIVTLRWGLKSIIAINTALGVDNPENVERSTFNEDIQP